MAVLKIENDNFYIVYCSGLVFLLDLFSRIAIIGEFGISFWLIPLSFSYILSLLLIVFD